MKNIYIYKYIYIHNSIGTWNHAVKGDGPLANEILANWVMIPNQEAYKSNL